MEKYSIIVVQTLDEKGRKNMRQLIKALKEIEGANVDIHTEHKLFGKQHIQMKFVPETEIGLGFRCKEQIIYIDNDNLVDYYVENDKAIINGKMMSIKIVKRS